MLIWMLARLRSQRVDKRPLAKSISVVVSAYNEAAVIGRKLDKIIASDCSDQIVEILVASDCSNDGTTDIVANYLDDRVRLLHFEERRGKPAVLNDVVPQCQSDIVVLMDSRQELEANSISELIANFSDPKVGVVSGELVFRAPEGNTTVGQGIGMYWKYEKFIRRHESQIRSVPGATGAIYGIRKELFERIHDLTILDDVVIPMQAVVKGYRCVFEPNAVAYDTPSQTTTKETLRKRRTIAGSAQLLLHHPSWILPWKNPIWFEFMSHKILRLASPLLLAVLAGANLALDEIPLYRVLLAFHVGFYLSAVVGYWFQMTGRKSKCFGVQLMFVRLNATTLAALWDALRGRFTAAWQKTT